MEKISVRELALKARSKNEVYHLMTTESKRRSREANPCRSEHLPAEEEPLHPPLFHADPDRRETRKPPRPLTLLLQHFLNPQVKRIDVPFYPNLSLDKVLAEFRRPHAIYDYLPDEVNEFLVNRQFVLDVSLQPGANRPQICNTLDSEKLQAFVQARVKEREKKISESDKSSISILPEFKAAILASHQVSGKSPPTALTHRSRARPSRPPAQAGDEEAEAEVGARGGEAVADRLEAQAGAVRRARADLRAAAARTRAAERDRHRDAPVHPGAAAAVEGAHSGAERGGRQRLHAGGRGGVRGGRRGEEGRPEHLTGRRARRAAEEAALPHLRPL